MRGSETWFHGSGEGGDEGGVAMHCLFELGWMESGVSSECKSVYALRRVILLYT